MSLRVADGGRAHPFDLFPVQAPAAHAGGEGGFGDFEWVLVGGGSGPRQIARDRFASAALISCAASDMNDPNLPSNADKARSN